MPNTIDADAELDDKPADAPPDTPPPPWRKYADNPLFVAVSSLLAGAAAFAWWFSMVCEVFSLIPVNLTGVGFVWMTVVGAPCFAVITGVNVANKMKTKPPTGPES